MKAADHTDTMLRWFEAQRVTRWDLAIRRCDGTFVCGNSSDLTFERMHICLPWARYENLCGSEVYVRPARGRHWPVIFFDDVRFDRARAVATRYRALVVRTSAAHQGASQVWLACDRPLDEALRASLQRLTAPRLRSDPASISGAHWGRLAGFRNHKRSGCWVDVIVERSEGPAYRARPGSAPEPRSRSMSGRYPSRRRQRRLGAERDESIVEFAWCCHELRRGAEPNDLVQRLSRRADARGKRQPLQYAIRTVHAAQRYLWPP